MDNVKLLVFVIMGYDIGWFRGILSSQETCSHPFSSFVFVFLSLSLSFSLSLSLLSMIYSIYTNIVPISRGH